MERGYQLKFSRNNAETMYAFAGRTKKAEKVLSILIEVCRDGKNMFLLDMGCSTGAMTKLYGPHFARVVGIDIDEEAVLYAASNNGAPNVEYFVKSADASGFEDESFDAICCNHIYEHVPDAEKLMGEIFRLLKPGGVCYFAADNRLHLMEKHYDLPFLSLLPKCLADRYVRFFGKADHYYETHLTLGGLRRLVRPFMVSDFTVKVMREPRKYAAGEMLSPGSVRQFLALGVAALFYWALPTYLWILKKPSH